MPDSKAKVNHVCQSLAEDKARTLVDPSEPSMMECLRMPEMLHSWILKKKQMLQTRRQAAFRIQKRQGTHFLL